MVKTPYPIKDFRDPEQYPRPEGLGVAWRWEFLRRHPDYQAFYEGHKRKKNDPEVLRELYVRFGAQLLVDPRHDSTSGRVSKIRGKPAPANLDDELFNPMIMQTSPQVVTFSVDRMAPLEPQFERIRREIGEINRAEGTASVAATNVKREWPRYLRFLDGEAEGAAPSAIADALYPNVPNVAPHYSLTHRMRDARRRAHELLNHQAAAKERPSR